MLLAFLSGLKFDLPIILLNGWIWASLASSNLYHCIFLLSLITYNWFWGFCQGVKWLKYEANHSPLFRAEVFMV
jgi:hypothetical protein